MLKKLSKTIFKFILIGVFIIAIFFLALYFFLSPHRLGESLETQFHQVTGMSLNIDGKLQWHVFPNLYLSLSDVSIQKQSRTLATIDSIQLSTEFLPLLEKHIVFDQISLKNPNINLFPISPTPKNKTITKNSPQENKFPFQFDIKNFSIKNGNFVLLNKQLKPTLTIQQINLNLAKITHLENFKLLSMQGNMTAKTLNSANIVLQQLKTDFSVQSQSLFIQNFKAQILKGILNTQGKISFASINPNYSLQGNISQIDLAELIPNFKQNPNVKIFGDGNANFQLTSQGNSLAQLTKNLNGDANINITNASILGFDFSQVLLSKAGLAHALLPNQNDQTPIQTLRANLVINNGIINNPTMTANASPLNITGSGKASLISKTLQYRLLVSVDQNSNAKLLELQKLFGGNIPINIQGPFTKLSYQADKSHLATNAAKYYLEKNSAEISNAIDKNAKGLGNIVSESIKKLFP